MSRSVLSVDLIYIFCLWDIGQVALLRGDPRSSSVQRSRPEQLRSELQVLSTVSGTQQVPVACAADGAG